MDSTKKLFHQYLIILIVAVIALNLYLHLLLFEIIPWSSDVFYKFLRPDRLIVFRVMVVFLPAFLAYLVPSVKAMRRINKETQKTYRVIWAVLGAILLYGYINLDFFYSFNLIFYPVLLIVVPYIAVIAFTKLGGNFINEDPLSVVNTTGTKDSLVMPTKDKGDLVIPLPHSSLFILGSPNAGKSGSWANRLVDIAVSRRWGCVLYELKGETMPLTHVLYNSIRKHLKDDEFNFGVVTTKNLDKSIRVNPMSRKYIKTKTDANSLALTLLLAIKKEWIQKPDFWSDNSIALAGAVVWRLIKDDSLAHLCNIPCLVVFISYDDDALIQWLLEDEESSYTVAPIANAVRRGSSDQVSSVFSTVQLSLNKLMTPEIFWIFSPSDEDAFDLNVKMSEKPTYISVANDQKNRDVLAPVLSVLLTVLKDNSNLEDGRDLLYLVDEFVSVFIKDFIQLAAEARSARVCTVVLTQNYSQLRELLGKDGADALTRTLSTWAVGMGSDVEIAQQMSTLFGKKKVVTESYSVSNDVTFSERTEHIPVLEPHDITGQEMGEFSGFIANGNPSRFKAKLQYFDPKKEYKTYYEIPTVKPPIDTGDPVSDYAVLLEIVEMNYTNLRKQVEDILEPYKKLMKNED